jgi:hypothetical protein
MQQEHAESKAEEKSPGAPARGKTNSEAASQARAVLNLQHAAGNRATARILGAPAGGATVQRTAALGAVSVQRDEWTDALKKELGTSRVIDFEALAKTLVRAHKESAGGKLKAVTDKSNEKSGEVTGTKPEKAESGKVEAGTKAPISKTSLVKEKASLRARETRFQRGPSKLEKEKADLERQGKKLELRELRRGPSKEETELRDLNEQVEALKAEQAQSESLRVREAKLRHRPTAAEKANEAKKAELDRLERRQQLDELKRKMAGRLTPEEQADRDLDEQFEQLKKHQELAEFERQRKPLNPRGKSLSELKKGGPRVWRG